MCAGVQETMSATGAGRLYSSGPTEEHPIILQPILSKRNTLRGRSSPISNWAGTMQARALSADTFASNSRDRNPPRSQKLNRSHQLELLLEEK